MESSRSFAIAFGKGTVLLILVVMALAFSLVVWFIVDIARTQDRKAFVQTTHFIRVFLNEKQQWLNKMVVDYADWGTAYKHLHLTVDTVWAYDQNNIGRTLVDDLGIEYGAVFDSNDQEVYSVVEGKLMREPTVSRLAGGVKDIVARARAMNPEGHEVATGLLYANGEPILIAASILAVGDDTSVTPDDRGPSVLLFGDRLTGREMTLMRDGLHLQELRFELADPGKIQPEDLFLHTSDRTAGFTLKVAAPKPGTEMLSAVLPWLGAVGVSLAIFVIFLARHGLRLAAMTQEVASNLARSHQLLEQQALYDPVTGLPNRIMFMRRLQEILTQPDARAVVLFLDLDRFKPINDTFGHEAGDFVLGEIGKRLSGCIAKQDLCARLGGDEFVAVVTKRNDAALYELCRRIIQTISAEMTYRGHTTSVGVSIGLTEVIPGRDSIEAVLRRADLALYDAKAAGRSSYRWFEQPKPAQFDMSA